MARAGIPHRRVRVPPAFPWLRRTAGGRPVPVAFLQPPGGRHGRAPVGGVEAGEREPGLIPQEDQVRLDGQALFHDPFDVVDDPVEGAVGQHQELDLVEPSGPPVGQQGPLDVLQRDSAVHPVLAERVRVEIGHLRSGLHQPVVVGLVAVAVDQHDLSGPDDRLQHDLVGRGRAVGHEEGLLGAEGPGGQLLRLLDRPDRVEQRVQAAGRGGGFGQEHVEPVELAHVLDPAGVDDRLPARDGQRVEHPGGLAAVVPQRAEERRLVPRLHPAQDRQVQLEPVFLEENAVEPAAELARDLLDRYLGYIWPWRTGPAGS